MAIEWTEGRKHKRQIHRAWLPEAGVVVALNEEPVMMLWIYFDPSCSMGFLDWVITRPGISFHSVTKPAMDYAHRQIIPQIMRDHSADTLAIRGPRVLIRHIPEGWSVDEEPLVSMGFIYQREEEHEEFRS